MAPRVTVLLPTHNRADVLGVAIKSVLAQTVADFELLVVGDGCTDATPNVVAGFTDPRIRWFDLPKAPLSGYANRNIALRQSTGSVVAYAQHDDLWFPDHLELLLAALARADAEWAYSRPLWVGPDGVICPSPVNLRLPDERDHFLNVENSIPSNCVMHSRAALERVGYWPEDQSGTADWLCWRRMIGSAGRVGFSRIPTSLHFRAIWRNFDSPAERAWRPMAQAPWWPAVLTRPNAAEPAQAAFWRAMSEPGNWVDEVRDASQAVLDRMAWSAITDLPTALDRTQADRAAAEAECRRALAEALDARRALDHQREAAGLAAAEAEQFRAALQAVLASTTWRATAPVRAAAGALKARLPAIR